MTDLMTDSAMTDRKSVLGIKAELPFSKNGWQRISAFKETVNTQSASSRSEVVRWTVDQELVTII